MSGMLFDTSPDEAGKKKARKRSVAFRDTTPKPVTVPAERRHEDARFLASIDGHVTCGECGIGIVDLVEVRHVNGQERWLVQCGWSCLTSWLVDPVPGVLDREDEKQATSPEFVVRGGRFDGMTFKQMDDAGHRNHIRALVEKGRTHVAAAAAEWLAANGG